MRTKGLRELWQAEGNESFHTLTGPGLGFSKELLFSEKTCLVLSTVRISILCVSLSLLPPLSNYFSLLGNGVGNVFQCSEHTFSSSSVGLTWQ